MLSTRTIRVVTVAVAIMLFVDYADVKSEKEYYLTRSEEEQYLRLEDMVVRGVITEVVPAVIRNDEWFVGTNLKPDYPFPVTYITLSQMEMLKGLWPDSTMVVVAGGGLPPGASPEYGPGVNTSMPIPYVSHTGTFDYREGEEVVFTLWFERNLLGGCYVITGDEGRYKRDQDVWQNVGTGRRVEIAAIEKAAAWGRLDDVSSRSDLVLECLIEGTDESSVARRDKETVTAKVVDVRRSSTRGLGVGDTIRFRLAEEQYADLATSYLLPLVKPGERWLVFLAKDDRGFFVVGDRNGLLKVHKEGFEPSGNAKHLLTIPQLEAVVTGGDEL